MRRAAPEIEPIVAKLREAGVSAPYASQLARGVRRPSQQMAVRIFDHTGLKMGCLADATAGEIRALQAIESRQQAEAA